jgi:hypothetical protein
MSMLHGSLSRDNVYVGRSCHNIDFTGGTSTGALTVEVPVAGMAGSMPAGGGQDYAVAGEGPPTTYPSRRIVSPKLSQIAGKFLGGGAAPGSTCWPV